MIWKVASLQEAIDWVKKFPNTMAEDGEVEIRPLMEPEDFAGVVSAERIEEVKELDANSGDKDGYGLARFNNAMEAWQRSGQANVAVESTQYNVSHFKDPP